MCGGGGGGKGLLLDKSSGRITLFHQVPNLRILVCIIFFRIEIQKSDG